MGRFDDVALNTQADVEELCKNCVDKIQAGKCKNSAIMFLRELIKAVEPLLDMKDTGDLEKSLAQLVKMKKVEKTAADSAKRKTNEKLSKNTKFNAADEVSVMYGGGGGDEEWDEEWDDADYEEYYAKK